MLLNLWTLLAVATLYVKCSSSFTARQVHRNLRQCTPSWEDADASTGSCCTTSTSLKASALIIQNKGGGHGELGYQLAKRLQQEDKITSITILQDQSCKDAQEPFKSYANDLPDVKIIQAALSDEAMTESDLQSLLGEETKFDYVWDNASKEPVGAAKACVDCAKTWNVQLYTYVSSAGVYKPTDATIFPMAETTPVKATAGQVALESYAIEQGLPLVSFRPQYIYGEKANKYDYM
jgi:nucleoside-diphosphate-sugar epimerase